MRERQPPVQVPLMSALTGGVCAQLKEVDTDNSGTIDIDEFMVAMKAKHGDVDQEEVTQPRTMSRSYAPFLLAEDERECDSDVGCRRGVTSCGST